MSAQDRRAQLVAIGLDLLGTRPIQELTLDEVAVAAGVSRTLVFHYFPSKGDYFAAVVISAGQRLMQAVPREAADDALAPGDDDPRERLRSMVDAFLRFVRRKRGAYVALVRGASGGDPIVLAALDEVRAEHVDRWLEAAAWPARDPLTRLSVRAWLCSLEEVALASATIPVPREVVVEMLVEALLDDLRRAGRLAGGLPAHPVGPGSGADDVVAAAARG
jgi:AcrR family transcriptional regulator